jgi:hypothetical protein
MKHLLFFFLVTVFSWVPIGCKDQPCNTVGAERCDGDMVQRCNSGVWQDWYDCTADDQECTTWENDTISCADAQACDDVCLE